MRAWPWLLFGLLAVVGLTLLWRATEPRPLAPPAVEADVPALGIEAEPTPDVIAPLLAVIAGMPGSAGNPAVLATAEPTPTMTPSPRRPTPTPWPSCPQPGAVCAWPDVVPTRIAPTATAYPVCVTPVPGDRCRDTAETRQDAPRTTDARCWSSGWRRVCSPSGGEGALK